MTGYYDQIINVLTESFELFQGMDPALLYIPLMLWYCLLVLGIVANLAGISTYLERKVAADIQQRIGPSEIHIRIPFTNIKIWAFGLFQFMADGIKLILKEDIIPEAADKPLFKLSPYIVFAGSFPVFAVIPISDGVYGADMNIGALYVLGVLSVGVIGILLAGWSSGNKWSLYGAMRSAAQIVSYELPAGITFLAVVMVMGSLNLNEIIARQQGWFYNWFLFWYIPFTPVMFLIFFIAGVAEVNRAPFDLPESESELVGGFHTEYTGMRFGFFFMAEYANMFLVGVMTSILFLGGWQPPYPGTILSGTYLPILEGLVWFLVKGYFFVLVMMFMRWTLPRYRVDQLMSLCWKVLIPISFVNLAFVGILEVYFDAGLF